MSDLLSHDQLVPMRKEETIVPLVKLIEKAKILKEKNDSDEPTRYCDFCFKKVPLAVDSFSMGKYDVCTACHAKCVECDTIEKMESLAELMFRRDVAHKLPKAERGIDNHLATQYCDACLTLVAIGTKLKSNMGQNMIFCDPCVDQIRLESANNFANMQPYPVRPHDVSKRSKQLEGVKSC